MSRIAREIFDTYKRALTYPLRKLSEVRREKEVRKRFNCLMQTGGPKLARYVRDNIRREVDSSLPSEIINRAAARTTAAFLAAVARSIEGDEKPGINEEKLNAMRAYLLTRLKLTPSLQRALEDFVYEGQRVEKLIGTTENLLEGLGIESDPTVAGTLAGLVDGILDRI